MNKYKEKNLEKLNELEQFQKDIDKQKKIVDKTTEEKSILEKRIVLLENDNSDHSNKIRELECWSEELRRKLDATLEENIVQNTDFDAFKCDMEVTIQRLKEELDEAKNELMSKQTIISRMTEQRDSLVKQARKDREENFDDINKNKLIKKFKKNSNFEQNNTTNHEELIGNSINNRISLPLNNNQKNVNLLLKKNEKTPNKFLQSYNKTCLELELSDQNKVGEKESKIL